MKRIGVFLILLFIALFSISMKGFAQENKERPIVIISSYNPDTRITTQNISGFVNTFKQLGGTAPVVIENMNCKSFPEAGRWYGRMRRILDKYRNDKMPLLYIVLGQEAWTSYLSQPDNITGTTPVLCGLASRNAILLPNQSDSVSLKDWEPESVDITHFQQKRQFIGGYLHEYDIEKNINLVLSLYPFTEHVALITDNSYGGVALQALVKKKMLQFPNLDLILLDGRCNSLYTITEQIKKLPRNTVILLGTWRVDVNDGYFVSNATYTMMSANPTIPAITITSTGLDHWAIGGYIPNYHPIGGDLARQAIDIIKNKKTEPLQPQIISNVYTFNAQQLKAFNISKKKLPAVYTLVNDDVNPFVKYKYEMMIAIIIILVIILTITIWFFRRMTKLRNRLLTTQEDNLTILNNIEAAISFVNPDHTIRWKNNAELLFDASDIVNTAMETGSKIDKIQELPKEHFVRILANPIKMEEDSLLGIVLKEEDVTNQKRNEIELSKAKEKAEEADHLKSAFLANMSHEIRNPINAILGLTRLVLADETLPEKQAQRLSMVLEASESLLRIVGDVLDYSKIEAGKLELESRPFSPRRLVASVVDEQRLAAEHKGLTLRHGVDEAVPCRVLGDAQRLRQILVNLVGNALKFTDTGRVEVAVSLDPGTGAAGDEAVRLLFSVSDTGIGLAPEQCTRIFDSFVQVDSGLTKRYAGSGLGLAICRKLTGLMGGEIWVESEPGRGATFRFTARFGAVACREPAEPGRRTANRRETDLPGLSVLVAEDNRINQLFTEDLLASRGHDVTVVGNGAEALDLLGRRHFDLVLMDVQMPVMDGLAATRAIRAHTGGLFDPDIPVLGLSAYAIKGDRERFMAAGMNDYLAKPIRFEDFFRAMRRLVRRRAGDTAKDGAYDPGHSRIELGVSPAAFGRMAALFVEEMPERLAAVQQALAAGDVQAAREAAHGLAGSAGALRAQDVLELAVRLEAALIAGNLDQSAALFPDLTAALGRVVDALRTFVAGEA